MDLRAEFGAALGTAALQYQAAGTGGHAGTETVNALAVQDAGLECTLHGWLTFIGAKILKMGNA